MYYFLTRENKNRLKLPPLLTRKYPVPVPVPLDDEKLSDEFQELVREEKAESIVCYGSDYVFQAKCKVPYKAEDKEYQ